MDNGWVGKIIRVNLTDESIKTEPLNRKNAALYLGGRGLGVKYCVDSAEPKADPLSPGNILAFMTGPLTGTLAPCAGMYTVVTKAPRSGEIGSCSLGGYFGPELKFAGCDGIIVEGKARGPVYLSIENGRTELRTAGHLWGKPVHTVIGELTKEAGGDAKIACIGQAGEELDWFAAILNDQNRTAGQLGFGAVMGSKNLKAIVIKGTGSIRAARNQEFLNACLKARNTIHAGSAAGATAVSNLPDGWRAYLAGNWKRPCFGKEDVIGGDTPEKLRSTGNGGCFGCFPDCRLTVANGRAHSTSFIHSLNDTDWSSGSGTAAGDAQKSEWLRNFMAVLESLGICPSAAAIGLHEAVEMFRACTGFGGSDEEILQIGERIRSLETAFNRKNGSPK